MCRGPIPEVESGFRNVAVVVRHERIEGAFQIDTVIIRVGNGIINQVGSGSHVIMNSPCIDI